MIRHISIQCVFLISFSLCTEPSSKPSGAAIGRLELKHGPLISCGPADRQFGSADFATGCSSKEANEFNLAVKLLHSFEYDEAEKVFAKIIDAQPQCAMAYWGCNG